MERSPARILLVGDYPPPNGGVATHVEELSRALRAQGADCQVLDIGKGQLPADGVHPAGGPASFASQLVSFATRGYRLHLHTSGANPKSWLLAQAVAAAGKLSGGALITLHSGLLPDWLAEDARRALLARTILSQYKSVICVNETIRAAVDGALVIPAFAQLSLKPGAAPRGLDELRASAAPLYCAMIAPRPEYGLPVLLEAFALVHAQSSNARLALYGPGSEEVRAPGVTGFGELHRPQALALMAASDVFLRPTLADGDSVSVREALALGRAVIASDAGHRPAGVTLVKAGDAAALALAMLSPPASAASASTDSFERLFSLYGIPEDRCAASAAS